MVKWFGAPSKWLGDNRINTEEKWVPLDGDIDKVELADDTQDDGLIVHAKHLSCGRPVRTEHVPTTWRYSPSSRALQRDAGYYHGQTMWVSPRLREIIEARDPGVHQFFPMRVLYRGKEMPPRYWMIVCHRLDTLVDDVCIPPINPTFRGYSRSTTRGGFTAPDWRVAYDEARLGGAHLFVDKRWYNLSVSDALAADIAAAGLEGVGTGDERILTLNSGAR